MKYKIALLPGDGIGPEVTNSAVKIIDLVAGKFNIDIEYENFEIGGISYEKHGSPLVEETIEGCYRADSVFLGAVGGHAWENLPHHLKPEAALLKLREKLELFANIRPARIYPSMFDNSTLKREVIDGTDFIVLRELTGGIYFGQPRGIRTLENGERQGFNTLVYSESEIERIARSAFVIARQRSKKLCSVDKANVLEVTELWREVVTRVGREYPDVALSHMYVDNAAMQLVRAPRQFDVIVTTNMFGDILSDEAAMLTGSIGMLPSASLDAGQKGMYEPIHGSAPDIAGRDIANPIATILSVAMMLRYTLNEPALAVRVERAVSAVLDQGLRTADIYTDGMTRIGTAQMGDAIIAALKA